MSAAFTIKNRNCAEFVVVEFNALVNNSNNDAGNNRDNTFLVTMGGAKVGGNSTIRIRTYEPSITDLLKIANPTVGDAGRSARLVSL